MIKLLVLPLLCSAVLSGDSDTAEAPSGKDAQAILAIERGAFERWAKGDPSGFLEASDPAVDYFDPFLENKLEGLDALRALYNPLRGQVQIDRWEMVRPRVLVEGNMGVLTFQFVSHSKGHTEKWNTTEVYRRKNGRWKIIHTHWSLTKPELKNFPAAGM
ncbi:MAG TPA: nuclear transport factor 2 family protein [Bryobacteraceae bacterium]|nr:nuclear transport factor 2 family protein [Bryobacteraceae bacterium]